MPQPTRRELDARSQAQLGVTWELRVRFAIVEEMFGGERASESSENVLSSNTVACKTQVRRHHLLASLSLSLVANPLTGFVEYDGIEL